MIILFGGLAAMLFLAVIFWILLRKKNLPHIVVPIPEIVQDVFKEEESPAGFDGRGRGQGADQHQRGGQQRGRATRHDGGERPADLDRPPSLGGSASASIAALWAGLREQARGLEECTPSPALARWGWADASGSFGIDGGSGCEEPAVEDPEHPSNWGVTFRQLQDFYMDNSPDLLQYCVEHKILKDHRHVCTRYPCCNPKHKLTPGIEVVDSENARDLVKEDLDPNMHAVVALCIKPLTREAKTSYARWKNKGALKKATHFVSHCWNELFEDFIKGLKWALGGNLDTSLWICSFALDQNADIAGQLGQRLEDAPFARALKESQHVLLMVDHKVEPPTRVWCVFELYLAGPDKYEKDIQLCPAGFNERLLSKIRERAQDMDVRNCKSSSETDRKKIMGELEGHEDAVNRVVRDCATSAHKYFIAFYHQYQTQAQAGDASA